MKRISPAFYAILVSLIIASLVFSCEQPFNLAEMVNNQASSDLTVSPESAMVIISSTLTLIASGGVSPYVFSMQSGTGSVNSSTGVYTAPALTGTDTVLVTDNTGSTATATISIISGGGPVPLSISPSAISVYVNSGTTFTATGGTSPYTFSMVSGSGTIDSATGVYSAPSLAGTDVVRVTDSAATTVDATVTVLDLSSNIDYGSLIVSNSGGTTAGGAISGDFTFTNNGTTDGSQTVSWEVYVSSDTAIGVGDLLIDSGTNAALTAGQTSSAIAFSGTWPVIAGNYYLIAKVSASDDFSTADNFNSSAVISVTAAPALDIDYYLSAVPAGGTIISTGAAISESFTLSNQGTDNGVQDIYWTAYISSDAVLDGADKVFDSGVETGLSSGGSTVLTVTGNWLQTAGTYYLIMGLVAGDDIATANNNAPSTALYTVTDPLALSPTNVTVNVGGTVSFSGSGGTAPYSYAVTSGTGTIDGGTGVYTAPAATGSATVQVTDANSYTMSTNVTITAVITNVNYDSAVVNHSAGTIGGGAFSGDFSFTNSGSSDGSQPIDWAIYVSTDTVVSAGDDLVDSGTVATPLTSGSSSGAIAYSGTWPAIGNTYYIIARISAADDVTTADNSGYVSVVVSDPDIDYQVTSGSISSVNNPAIGGSAISETFTVTNNGTIDGSQPVFWTAYISSDNTLDAGDVPIDAGQISALTGGGVSGSVSIDNGQWPSVDTTTSYYLFVEVSASDENAASTGNNNDSAAFSITVPDIDYTVTSVSNSTTPADVGTAISETFTYSNIGADNGNSTVIWNAYYSTDTVFDGSDQFIDSGTASALTSGSTSGNIAISGTWPAVAGTYYLIVTLSSSDETTVLNNYASSGSFEILSNTASPDYVVTAVSSSYPTVTTGSALSETFSLTNSSSTDGVDPVTWTAWASTDTTLGGDTQIATGSVSALTGGATSSGIVLSGNWAVSAGTYYLIVQVSATDEGDTTNNILYSGPFTVYAPPDYIISSPSLPIEQYGGNTNEALNLVEGTHSFQISENSGANDGHQTISWKVYVSDNASLDGSDTLFDSGSISPLSAGASSGVITFDNNLPATPGLYYFIIQLNAGDDSDSGNNSYTSTGLSIWQTSGNLETDQAEDDIYLSDAEDYNILLNPGDTVQITGTIDDYIAYPDSSGDLFKVLTGPAVSGLEVSVTWSTGADDLDFYLFDSTGSLVDSSIETAVDSEPADPVGTPWTTAVSAASLYYVNVIAYLEDFAGSSSPGQNYTLTISGY